MKIKIIDYSGGRGLQLPKRAHYNDAGADVYNPEAVYIANGQTVNIGLGFGVEIPDGHMGLIYVRSGMAKKGITVEMPPIDSGYRGEIHCLITNHTGQAIKFEKGDRIGQLVIQPCILADFVEELSEERGTGAFGSTGV